MFVQRKGNVDLMSCFLCVVLSLFIASPVSFRNEEKRGKGGEGTRAEQSVGDFGEFQVFYKTVVDVYFNLGGESVSGTPYHIGQLRTRVRRI